MKRMTALFLLALSLIAAVALTYRVAPLAAQTPAPAGGTGALRIGTYDSRAIAVAYASSPASGAAVQGLRQDMDKAKAAGDTKKVEQIQAQGQQLQTLRHMQAFSNAPIDDILKTIQDKLPAIAREAKVDLIVAKPDYLAPGVEMVDLTDRLVAEFHPNDRVIKTIAELRKHSPITLLEALAIKD